MSTRVRNDTFVCLDDVTGKPEPLNYVIYNPSKDTVSFRVDLLYRTIKEGAGIELTSEQLIHLTKYDVHQLNDFVEELREIIEKYKKEHIKDMGA